MRWLVVLALVACAHADAPAAGFRLSYPDTAAKVGTRFQLKPAATCNYADGRSARWTITGAHLESGELPPGLAIEDGAFSGLPTRAGTFTARIALSGVSCAGKPLADEHVDVTLTVR